MKKKLTLAFVLITSTAAAFGYRQLQNEVIDRFSYLDPTKVRRTYNKMMLLCFTNQMPEAAEADDREMDQLFLKLYYAS